MVKQYQLSIIICFIFAMLLSGFRCDGADISLPVTTELPDTISVAESCISEIQTEYARLSKQEYWNVENTIHLATSFFENAQYRYRIHVRRNVLLSALMGSFNVILFSIIMILFATGGTGLSMPFRCLLYYIHNIDGKKKYC